MVGLAVTVANLSLLQTLVVPVLSMIAQQLDTSLSAVSWVLTANLLAAAVLTPVLGRLGDVYGKRPVMIGILVVVLIGTLIALLTSSLPVLILARVLQGASYGLFPLSMGVLRDEVPAERLGDLHGPDADRVRELRRALGIDASDDAAPYVTGDGVPVSADDQRFRRMASLTALSLETNGGMCRDLLRVRYGEEVAA
jgi:MFS family permease